MDRTMAALRNFLLRHNLPLDGVRLVVEMPSRELAFRAHDCMKLDFKPLQMDMTMSSPGEIDKIMGIPIRFEAKK